MLAKQDIYYALTSLRKTLQGIGRTCPSCDAYDSTIVDRKMLITALRRCSQCGLQFRTPTTSAEENDVFYQDMYQQGFTTELPDEVTLITLMQQSFSASDKDYSSYIRLLQHFGVQQGARILDFGCSWGYGSWQFKQEGYEVVSTEISDPRRLYAINKLGIDAHKDLNTISGTFDVFFSAHVLEHVPSPVRVLSDALHLLKPGGLFLAITPNGSDQYRKLHPESWHKLWGKVHPNFLDEVFYEKNIPYPFEVGSIHQGKPNPADLSYYELYCGFRKPKA